MDRGVPTEEVLAEMRAADPPVHYLVGTPKGRLTRLEKQLIARGKGVYDYRFALETAVPRAQRRAAA
jgi:hypothetical protein